MTVFVHSIVIICFRFLFVDRLGPTATLTADLISSETHFIAFVGGGGVYD